VHLNTRLAWRIAPVGLLTGFAAGFFGIGGGFLIAPGLMAATGMTLANASASSLVSVTLFGSATSANYAISGLVDWTLFAMLVIGGFAGTLAGAPAAKALASRALLGRRMFAGLILVALPAENAAALETELKDLSSSGLSVQVTATAEHTVPSDGRNITLTVIGPDRLGIVREISHALAKRHINVLDMDTEVASAPMSAEMIFTARITAWIPDTTDMQDLEAGLDEIADQMTLEIDLD